MTKPIEDMELREAVAVEIMGVHVRKQRGARSHLRDLVIPGGVNGIDFVQEEGEPELTVRDLIGGVPAYESSIEAAFAVVEKMRETVCMEMTCGEAGYMVEFTPYCGQGWGAFQSESLPLAICRAALAACRAQK